MADIQCTSDDKRYNSLTVRMTDLQTDYAGDVRRVDWYYVVADTDIEPWYMTGYEYSGESYLYDSSETQGDYTIRALLANTTYYIRADITEENTGNTFGPFYGTATTLKSGFENATIMTSSSGATYSKINVTLRNVNMGLAIDNGSYAVEWYITTADNIYYELSNEIRDVFFDNYGRGASHSFTGLNENTKYSIKCVVYDPEGTEIKRLFATHQTDYRWLELSDLTTVQIAGTKNVMFSWTVNNYEFAGRYVIGLSEDLMLDPEEAEASMVAEGTVDGKYSEVIVDCSAFESGKYYYAVCVYRKNIDESYVVHRGYITLTDPASITPWSWEETEQRQIALYALENNGNIEDFKFQVWNDLVDKVMETINTDTINGIEWYTSTNGGSTTYLPYDQTRMTEDDRYITAARFNALKYNIGSRVGASYTDPDTQSIMTGTGISDVSKGDIIYGWYFTRLTESLNNWINSL